MIDGDRLKAVCSDQFFPEADERAVIIFDGISVHETAQMARDIRGSAGEYEPNRRDNV
jgi:hypothetical protein